MIHLYMTFIFNYFSEDGRGGRTGNLESKYRGLVSVVDMKVSIADSISSRARWESFRALNTLLVVDTLV